MYITLTLLLTVPLILHKLTPLATARAGLWQSVAVALAAPYEPRLQATHPYYDTMLH